MRRLRFRLELRWLMVLVAVLALILGGGINLQQRQVAFQARSAAYFVQSSEPQRILRAGIDPRTYVLRAGDEPEWRKQQARSKFFREMSAKYYYAAAHPWLPVEADPPVPD